MTTDDIIRMAKEAGYGWSLADIHAPALERFAALVAAEVHKTYSPRIERIVRLVEAAEREACAKVCEETTAAWTQHLYNSGCLDCAAAIRARGEQEEPR